MDKESHELARAGLDVYAGEMAPTYEEMRARLVGRLSANGLQLETMQAQEISRQNNYNLVEEFITELPQAHDHKHVQSLLVDNAHHARQLEAALLWVTVSHGYYSRTGSVVPHYIIGRRQLEPGEVDNRRHEATELIVFSAQEKPKARIVRVWTDQLAMCETEVLRAANLKYTEDEMDRMFDPDTCLLRVGMSGRTMNTQLARTEEFLPTPPRAKKVAKMLKYEGMQATMKGELQGRIDDSVRAAYDIDTALNRLAVAFGKVDVLDALHEKYSAAAQEDPVDAVLRPELPEA